MGEIMGALARDPDLGQLLGLQALTADERFFEAGIMFQDMDTDRGGDVDIDEFVAFFGKPNRPTQKLSAHQVEQLQTAFGRLDINGDGAISKEEIMSALARDPDLGELLGMSAHLTADERFFQAGVIFQDMDTDRGGDVDVDEFIAFFGVAPSEAAELSRMPETTAEAGEEGTETKTLTSRLGNFLGLPAEDTSPPFEPEAQSATDDDEDKNDVQIRP